MKELETIEQLKNDILNGEELQYEYAIDAVRVTVITDDYPWVRIIAGGCEWETYVGNEHYDGLSLDDTLAELAKFIECESIKSAIRKAIHDHRMKKNVGLIATAEYIIAVADFNDTVIRYYGNDKDVSTIVLNADLVDDEDGIITKVAEFFANY